MVIKRKKEVTKKAKTKKGDGCKLTKATGRKDLDDDEGNIRKKKPNSTLSSSMVKNQHGRSEKTG